jgi:gliding motility-associated-like protein
MKNPFRYKKVLILVMLLVSQWTYSQLNDFTLVVNSTQETCTANGTLSFTVTNTTAGASMLYAIYKLPNTTTPLAVVTALSYNGLTSGNYLVIATQSLGAQSGTQQQQITILDQRVILTYQVSSTEVVCGNDGVIAIQTLTGSAATYAITNGPVTRPPQTSNVFSNLPAGQFTIRVIDVCGEGIVQAYTLTAKNPALAFTLNPASLSGCNTVNLGFNFSTVALDPIGIIKYPLQIVTTINPPSGSPIVTTNTLTNGTTFTFPSSLYTPQPYTYSFVITDGCGVVYTLNGIVNNLSINSISSNLIPVNCTTKKIKFEPLIGLVLLTAPASYPNTLPQDFTSQISNNTITTQPLGVGTYTFQATNLCGQPQILTVIIQVEPSNQPYDFAFGLTCNSGSLAFYYVSHIVLVNAPPAYTGTLPYDFSATINSSNIAILQQLPAGAYTFNVLDLCGNPSVIFGTISPIATGPSYSVYPDCSGTNTNTLKVQGELVTIILTAAPASYTTSLPQNMTAQVVSNVLTLAGLPVGNYSFSVTNTCGTVSALPVVIGPQQETTNVNVIQNCGSFNLDLHHSSSNATTSTFWLQKFNTIANDWGHPSTGILQGTNLPNVNNAVSLINNTLNLNLAYSGQFRIVKLQPVYIPGNPAVAYCFKVINEFQTNGLPQITNVNSVSCNITFDVIVSAIGFGPLTYKITTKNGQPFLIDNGTSNLFTSLTPALYTFQVIDFCGNIVNSVYEINVQNPIAITATQVCPNQPVTFSVPNYGFLTYKWWRNTNPTLILSTTNILTLPNYNPVTQSGTYTVQVIYAANPTSCMNATYTYTLNAADFAPHAGGDNAVSYCGSQGTINLFSLLTGSYDTNGSWQVTSNNTTITNSYWNATAVSATTVFQFQYTVLATGGCNVKDDALVTITLKDIPVLPTASVDPQLCEGENVNLYANSPTVGSYSWSGPNGFTSTLQNPILTNATPANNGEYAVLLTKAGCVSEPASVSVLVNPKPQFTVSGQCNNHHYVVTAIPLADSFDPTTGSYSWTGPMGYSNSINPIDITQFPLGTYSVLYTNTAGCQNTNDVEVSYTFCDIPNVITPNDDGANDSFELSGLGVSKLEIYNRWGEKVYEKEGYLNEWHGQNSQGTQLPDSTYYYYILLNSQESKVGWVFVSKG